jgi:hypothetical protein
MLKGLSHPAVTRLQRTWEAVDQKSWEILRELRGLVGIGECGYVSVSRNSKDGKVGKGQNGSEGTEEEDEEEFIEKHIGLFGTVSGEGLSSFASCYATLRSPKQQVGFLAEFLEAQVENNGGDTRAFGVIPWLEPLGQELLELKKDYTVAVDSSNATSTTKSQTSGDTSGNNSGSGVLEDVVGWNVVLSETGQRCVEEIISLVERCQGTLVTNEKETENSRKAKEAAASQIQNNVVLAGPQETTTNGPAEDDESTFDFDFPSVPTSNPLSSTTSTTSVKKSKNSSTDSQTQQSGIVNWKGGKGLGIPDGSGNYGMPFANLLPPPKTSKNKSANNTNNILTPLVLSSPSSSGSNISSALLLTIPPWDRPLAIPAYVVPDLDIESLGAGDLRCLHWLLTRQFIGWEMCWSWSFRCDGELKREGEDVLELLEDWRREVGKIVSRLREREIQEQKDREESMLKQKEEETQRQRELLERERRLKEAKVDVESEVDVNGEVGASDLNNLMARLRGTSTQAVDLDVHGSVDDFDSDDNHDEGDEGAEDIEIQKDLLRKLLVAGSGNAPLPTSVSQSVVTQDENNLGDSAFDNVDELERFREYQRALNSSSVESTPFTTPYQTQFPIETYSSSSVDEEFRDTRTEAEKMQDDADFKRRLMDLEGLLLPKTEPDVPNSVGGTVADQGDDEEVGNYGDQKEENSEDERKAEGDVMDLLARRLAMLGPGKK